MLASVAQLDQDKVSVAMGHARYLLAMAIEFQASGYGPEAVDFRLGQCLDHMFVVGTENARVLLSETRAGRYNCPETGKRLADTAAGQVVADRIIELGRAARS